MTFRAAWLLVMLAGTAGCNEQLPQRQFCDQDTPPEDCCPPGSHQVFSDFNPWFIVCGPNEDAGAGDGACDDGGTDAP